MIVRNYTGEDGKSHFEDVTLTFEAYATCANGPHCKGPQACDSSGGPPVFSWIGIPRLAGST
jgi:hypothetical protein